MKSLTVRFTFLFLGLAFMSGAPAFAAKITGTIVYEGKVPTMKEIKMDADPICAGKHSAPVRAEVLVLGNGQTMGNVFVHVKSGLPQKEYPVPKEAVVLNQVGCTYVPHVFGIRAGQTLKILNSDGTLHNVHVMPKVNRVFNLAMPKTKTTATSVFDKPEPLFSIKCDVHPWMGAYCAVMSHPFYATTQKDGKFTLDGLPAGTYEIEAWHERLGTKTAKITVTANDTKTVNFSFSVPAK
ncbi:MAG: carboxypeptidase regulatory-like domain-containing protein [Acidobacteria bacterium]|nr:carboxypeptidase regulatory-like domain-containing protein [Acidobacteriota bacterium]